MIEDYLKHLGASYQKPSLAYLIELQQKHVSRVPFENIDVVCDVELSLELDYLQEKVFIRRHGGFCYELNWLFFNLLKHLGFEVSLMKGQVYSTKGIPGPEFDHLCLRVDLDNESWLVDVGFGKSFIQPLIISHGYICTKTKFEFQVACIQSGRFEIRSVERNRINSMYFFDIGEQCIESFYDQFKFKQFSVDSPFRKKLICARYDAQGWYTIKNSVFRYPTGRMLIESESHLKSILLEHFDRSMLVGLNEETTARLF